MRRHEPCKNWTLETLDCGLWLNFFELFEAAPEADAGDRLVFAMSNVTCVRRREVCAFTAGQPGTKQWHMKLNFVELLEAILETDARGRLVSAMFECLIKSFKPAFSQQWPLASMAPEAQLR